MTSSHIYSYVYRLDNPKTGEFYIGYRCANKVKSTDDLGKYYFTSSKKIKPRFTDFIPTILAEFYDKNDAYEFEQTLIKENINNPLILNASYDKSGKIKFHTIGKSYTRSNETKAKMSEIMKNRYVGMKRSDEAKAKMSAAKMGISRSAEFCKAVSNALKGKPKSEQAKRNTSKAKKGIKFSDEHKANLSKAAIGKHSSPRSDETKAKMSAAKMGIEFSDEHKANLSKAAKRRWENKSLATTECTIT